MSHVPFCCLCVFQAAMFMFRFVRDARVLFGCFCMSHVPFCCLCVFQAAMFMFRFVRDARVLFGCLCMSHVPFCGLCMSPFTKDRDSNSIPFVLTMKKGFLIGAKKKKKEATVASATAASPKPMS